MPLIPALGRKRLVDLLRWEASLVYVVSSRPARITKRDLVSKKPPPAPKKRIIQRYIVATTGLAKT